MHRLLASIFVTAACHAPAFGADFSPRFAPGAHKLQNGQANERLAEWQPQAVAIEEMSGLRCAFMRGYPQRYADTTKSYCWDPAVAKAATGLDVPEANAQVERLLAAWPAAPSPGERRKLAALFLAAGERASAVVQWLRLPAGERRAADGLPDSLVKLLNKFVQRRDESYQIAAVLAARGGHDRVYPIDDQTAASPDGDMKAYAAAIGKAWDNPYTAARTRQSEEVEGRLGTPAGVVAMYRAYNDAGAAEQTFRSDFGAALEEPSPQHFGRGYVGYWETRNLRMASNIRDVMTARPGIRVLVIVGASHKAYLEAYLDQMHDVRIVSTDRVLRTE